MPLHSIMPLFGITNQNINAVKCNAKPRSSGLERFIRSAALLLYAVGSTEKR